MVQGTADNLKMTFVNYLGPRSTYPPNHKCKPNFERVLDSPKFPTSRIPYEFPVEALPAVPEASKRKHKKTKKAWPSPQFAKTIGIGLGPVCSPANKDLV